jgi:mono/diheme cytochrome c family protein
MTWVRPLLVASLALAFPGSPFLSGLTAAARPARPAEPEKKESGEVSYYREVRRLFQQHCQGCHQPAKPLGGFVMTGHADLFKKGDQDKPGIVPGRPDQSFLVEQILAAPGKKPAMPKGRDPLPAADVELIKKWIAQGARDDTPPNAREVVDTAHPPAYVLPPVISSIDFSPDGTLLAVAGGSPARFGEVQIWDVAKRKLKLAVPVTFDTLYGVSWSHDGSKIAFGCTDNTLRAIDATTGKQVLFQGAHNDWVLGTVFSRDSSYLASISRDRSVKLTEVATQRFIDNITSITPGALKGGLMAMDRNPVKGDRKVKSKAAGTDMTEKWYDELLVAGADGVPRLYQMHRTSKRVIGDDANKLREYPPMTGRIHVLRFSPDGALFAAGSSLDGKGELRVSQTAGGQIVSRLEGEPGPVYTLAWRPDGKVLASAGFDGMVRFSDPATGKKIKEFIPVPLANTSVKAK